MTFHRPVFVGDEMTCYAQIIKVGRTSITSRSRAGCGRARSRSSDRHGERLASRPEPSGQSVRSRGRDPFQALLGPPNGLGLGFWAVLALDAPLGAGALAPPCPVRPVQGRVGPRRGQMKRFNVDRVGGGVR
jgi:hypothetical protein